MGVTIWASSMMITCTMEQRLGGSDEIIGDPLAQETPSNNHNDKKYRFSLMTHSLSHAFATGLLNWSPSKVIINGFSQPSSMLFVPVLNGIKKTTHALKKLNNRIDLLVIHDTPHTGLSRMSLTMLIGTVCPGIPLGSVRIRRSLRSLQVM